VRNCPPQTHQLIGIERCQRTRGSLRRLATQERNVPRNASLDILQVGTHLGRVWCNFRGSSSACARTVRSCTSLCAAWNRLRPRLSLERSPRSCVFGAPAGSITVSPQGRSQSRQELRQTLPYTTILCHMNSAWHSYLLNLCIAVVVLTVHFGPYELWQLYLQNLSDGIPFVLVKVPSSI
jgi:hypothetical protein